MKRWLAWGYLVAVLLTVGGCVWALEAVRSGMCLIYGLDCSGPRW